MLFFSFLRLPEDDDGNMNKPGSLPDLTNFHVNCGGGHTDPSPPMIGSAVGQHQYSVGTACPEGDDNMGSPYSSVSQIRSYHSLIKISVSCILPVLSLRVKRGCTPGSVAQ